MTSFRNPSEFTAPKPSELAEDGALVAVELLEKQPGTFIDGDGPLDAARVRLLVVDGKYSGYAEERQLRNAGLVRVLIHPKVKVGEVLIARLGNVTTSNGRKAVVFTEVNAQDRQAAERTWSAHINGNGGSPEVQDDPPF